MKTKSEFSIETNCTDKTPPHPVSMSLVYAMVEALGAENTRWICFTLPTIRSHVKYLMNIFQGNSGHIINKLYFTCSNTLLLEHQDFYYILYCGRFLEAVPLRHL